MKTQRVGSAAQRVQVRVPATSANLGAGYDSFGLALDLCDEVSATLHPEPIDPREAVRVRGEGEGQLPTDTSHLIHRVAGEVMASRGLDAAARLSLECRNRIPQSRGMGSSAAAVVAGITVADSLLQGCGLGELGAAARLAWATKFEGHPDNAAPALFGGVTISFIDSHRAPQSVSIPVHEDVSTVLIVPAERLDTAVARSLIPTTVPHADAAANSAVAGLFVHAIGNDPSLLFEATVDRLHQNYRRPAMARSLERVDALRSAGLAAVISGAGPTVAVLGDQEDLFEQVVTVLSGDTAQFLPVGISQAGVEATALSVGPRA
jgi:homoserine kinase